MALLALVSWAALFQGCIAAGTLDCAVREDRAKDPDWTCKKASNWKGSCVPASAFAAWGCLELDVDATLCKDEKPFLMTVYLSTSNVSLEGNGQLIGTASSVAAEPQAATEAGTDSDPEAVAEADTASESLAPSSVHSGARTPYTYSVSNIALRNLTISNVAGYGLDLKRFFRAEQLDGPLEGHRDIVVENVRISHPTKIGVYVGQNSRDFVFRQLKVEQAYIGVYLEAGSRHTVISDGEIKNSRSREGLAIDSSQHNVIEHVTFSGNFGHDAVKLYKNCGELNGQVCPIRRENGASFNELRDNVFQGDAVTVASRQLKPVYVGLCLDVELSGSWRDQASDNVFEGNEFRDTRLVVQDTPITIEGNDFYSSELSVGAVGPLREDPARLSGEITSNLFEQSTIVGLKWLTEFAPGLRIHDNLGVR